MLRRSFATSGLIVAAIGLASPARGAEVVLGQRAVVLELEAADVTVTISHEPARLRSTSRDPKAESGSELDVTFDHQSVQVRRRSRPEGQHGPRSRIQVSVWIGATQPLSILGSDLDLEVTGLPAPEPVDPPFGDGDEQEEKKDEPTVRQTTPSAPHDPTPPALLEIGVAASTITLSQTADTTLALAGSRVRAEATRGSLRVLAEDGSEAELLGHRGSIVLEATASDVVIVEAEANVEATLDTANLLLQDGRGAIDVRARGGLLVLERWRGNETIRGNATTIELRETGPRSAITGSALRVIAENGRGALDITSDQGGELEIADWVGRATVNLSGGGALEARRIKAPLSIVLARGARGEVSDVASLFDATLRDAELTLERARSFKLEATDAVVVATGIKRLAQIEAQRSRLELDLTDTRSFGRFVADKDSELILDLREPCRVVIGGSAGKGGGEDVNANRCFVNLAGTPTPGKPFLPGQRHIASVVRIELEAGGRITATGHAPR